MKLFLVLLALASATTYFSESFGPGWESRWVKSTFKGDEAGELVSADDGVKTATDARFYQYSAVFTPFSNVRLFFFFFFSFFSFCPLRSRSARMTRTCLAFVVKCLTCACEA